MFVDLDTTQGQGEWFQFFGSHINMDTGETIYDEPTGDARVQIRGYTTFFEDRMAKRKKSFEHIFNPKTRAMERVLYYPEQTGMEIKAELDDLYDFAITGLENFKNEKTGEIISCIRENKLKLMKIPIFSRFVMRCQQLLADTGIKQNEELEKN